MHDTDLDRPLPKNWRERLAYTREMKEMLVWVWNNFISAQGKKLAKQIIIIAFFQAVCGLLISWIAALIINGLVAKNNKSIVISYAAFCVLYLIQIKLANSQSKRREHAWSVNGRKLHDYILRLFYEKSLGQHSTEQALLNKEVIEKGEERIRNIQNGLLIGGVDVIFGLILSYIALWFLHWLTGLLATAMVLTHIVWALYLNQQTLLINIPLEKRWRERDRYRLARIQYVERVKTAAKETEEADEMDRQYLENISPDLKFWLWYINQTGWRGMVARILMMLIMGFGAYQINNNLMAIGFLVPLLNWGMNLVQNLWQIGDLEYRINYATPPILALKRALNLPRGLVKIADSVNLSREAACRIVFENIGFAYPDSNQPVLKEVNFTIEPGEKVALLGKSGIGKTTIMKLLLRYTDPNCGKITVDGLDLKEIEINSWLDKVGYIPQQIVIWNGTVRYNLLYQLSPQQRDLIGNEQLLELMDLLQINFGERLNKGLDTLVGEMGMKLSGGEAQRLIIGSAVIKNPKVLIVDEATSSLDASTEKLTWEGMTKVLKENRSALIITHRLNTVRQTCDKFVILNSNNRGSYVEAIANSFEELAEKSETFRLLAKDQRIEV